MKRVAGRKLKLTELRIIFAHLALVDGHGAHRRVKTRTGFWGGTLKNDHIEVLGVNSEVEGVGCGGILN